MSLGKGLAVWRSMGLAVLGVVGLASAAQAQYIGVTTPFQSYTDSYFSRVGTNFGFHLPGARGNHGVVGLLPNGQLAPDGVIRFGQGSFGSAVPPFGGYDPGADAHLGFMVGGRGGPGFSFNISASQGSTRTASMIAPTIVVPNGGTGTLFFGQQRPFVTGIVPVVGFMPPTYFTQPVAPTYINPVAYKLALLDRQLAAGQQPDVWRHDDEDGDGLSLSGRAPAPRSNASSTSTRPDRSTASQPARSLAEIRRSRQSADDRAERERREKFADHIAAAQFALERRNERSARSNLDRARQYAETEDERELIESLLESLDR